MYYWYIAITWSLYSEKFPWLVTIVCGFKLYTSYSILGRNSLIRHSDLRYKIQVTVWSCWEMVGTATRKIYLGKDSVRAINCKIISDPFTCT